MSSSPEDFEALIEYLRDVRHFDFTGYRRATLMRRTQQRLDEIGVSSFVAYRDYLEVHPEEFAALFDRFLINVTGFFRDKPSWDYLMSEIIPRIAQRAESRDSIRVWSAGCATGEEAYSLSIAFGEVLGVDTLLERVKIFATDADEQALDIARRGAFTPRDVAALDPLVLDRYFEREGRRFVVRPQYRRSIVFGRHDLTAHAPMTGLDLLVCRNTLMYFNAETQETILSRMHTALKSGGFLFLGRAEMVLGPWSLFTPVELKHRIFQRNPASPHQALSSQAANDPPASTDIVRASLAALPSALITIDRNGRVSSINRRAQSLFGLRERDAGRPLQDLEISYRPVELRGPIDRAYSESTAVMIREVEYAVSSHPPHYFDVTITPLHDERGEVIGACVVFDDLTVHRDARERSRRTAERLANANEDLVSLNKQLETTNEELRSTVEELAATGEELQSTTAELEALNQEMQQTNTELQALNDELHQRTELLDRDNRLSRAILSSLRAGIAVLDPARKVVLWSKPAEDLWGMRAREAIGSVFADLDIGLPADKLEPSISACLEGASAETIRLTATNRKGKTILCDVTCLSLLDRHGTSGVVVMMEVAS